MNNENFKMNNDLETRKTKRKKKPVRVNINSIKYLILLITMWAIFLATFIVGFVVHYEVDNSVTASSVIWTLSFIVFVISIIFTLLYYKARKARNIEESEKFLRYLPI